MLYTSASRPVLRPTQSPIQWVHAALSLGIKEPGHCNEASRGRPGSGLVRVNKWIKARNWQGGNKAERDYHINKAK
jgi:hypothetical protein